MIGCLYIHICTNAHTYTDTRRHPSIPTYIYSHMHTHMHAHIYVYTNTHTYIYIGLASANMVSLRSDGKDWNIRLKEGDF